MHARMIRISYWLLPNRGINCGITLHRGCDWAKNSRPHARGNNSRAECGAVTSTNTLAIGRHCRHLRYIFVYTSGSSCQAKLSTIHTFFADTLGIGMRQAAELICAYIPSRRALFFPTFWRDAVWDAIRGGNPGSGVDDWNETRENLLQTSCQV